MVPHPRTTVTHAHITQDKTGRWQVTLELPDNKIHLAVTGIEELADELATAYHPEDLDLPANTEFRISMNEKPIDPNPAPYKPRAQRTKPPYYVVKNGKKVREVLK